jgi:hypothetical protein
MARSSCHGKHRDDSEKTPLEAGLLAAMVEVEEVISANWGSHHLCEPLIVGEDERRRCAVDGSP